MIQFLSMITIPLWFVCSSANSIFYDVFEQVGEIIIQTPDSIAIGDVASMDVDSSGNFLVGDRIGKQVLKFSNRGEFLKVVAREGKGPGEVLSPYCSVGPNSRIYVVDSKNQRLSIFTDKGEFQGSFVPSDVSIPLRVEVDQYGYIYIGAFRSDPNNRLGGFLIHKYSPDGERMKSFFPLEKRAQDRYLRRFVRRCDFTIADDLIFAVQPVTYDICKYNTDGELLDKYSYNPSDYIPPSKIPDFLKKGRPTGEQLLKWLESWTEVADIIDCKGILMVVLTRTRSHPFLLDIYDYAGNELIQGVQTDFYPACVDEERNIYFLLTRQEPYKIGKFKIISRDILDFFK